MEYGIGFLRFNRELRKAKRGSPAIQCLKITTPDTAYDCRLLLTVMAFATKPTQYTEYTSSRYSSAVMHFVHICSSTCSYLNGVCHFLLKLPGIILEIIEIKTRFI